MYDLMLFFILVHQLEPENEDLLADLCYLEDCSVSIYHLILWIG